MRSQAPRLGRYVAQPEATGEKTALARKGNEDAVDPTGGSSYRRRQQRSNHWQRATATRPCHYYVLTSQQQMPSSFEDDLVALRQFLNDSEFRRSGVVMTDLDGTAVLEREGRIYLPPSVERGLQRVHAHGRPIIANTLRFPLSVINVFGAEWHRVTGAELPLVSMKGSQIGRVVRAASGEFSFEEWSATTLLPGEIDEVLDGVDGTVSQGLDDLLVFFYRRDWRQGERIWTPKVERVNAVTAKFKSASNVFGGSVEVLREALHAQQVCMIFLLIDAPRDRLMAYQHTNRNSFFTHGSTGKADGARAIASRLGFNLSDCIGAGDASPDDFLAETGYSVIVGNGQLDFKGVRHTARVADVAALGDLLDALADDLDS